jgi:hypothetical protein
VKRPGQGTLAPASREGLAVLDGWESKPRAEAVLLSLHTLGLAGTEPSVASIRRTLKDGWADE